MNCPGWNTGVQMIKPADGCVPTVSHSSASVFQAGDGRIFFTESIMPGDFNPCA